MRSCALLNHSHRQAVNGTEVVYIEALAKSGLMRRRVGSGVWVVRLTNFLGAVSSRCRCATGIRASGRIIGSPSPCGPVRAIGGRAGTVDAAVPCTVAVVDVVFVYDRATVPIAVPVAVTPSATAIAHRGAYCDTNSECKHSGRHYGCRAIPRRRNRSAVDNRGVVLRDVHHLWIGRLNLIISGDCCTTLICGPDLRLPAACALARNACTADIMSAGCMWYASPKDEVQL